jgi:hypothetical protein
LLDVEFCNEYLKDTSRPYPFCYRLMEDKLRLLLKASGTLCFSMCRAEQEGTQLTTIDMQPFLDFVKRGNLQTEFFSIRPNQCECL